MKMISFCMLFALSLCSFAQSSLQSIVNDFYAFENVLNKKRDNRCRPKGSCFRKACDSVGNFECDDQDEIDQIKRSCRGVWGSECLTTAMSFLHRFEYDSLEEMTELASSCRGVYDTSCVKYTCKRLKPFGCDDLEEIVKVNRSCAGYDD